MPEKNHEQAAQHNEEAAKHHRKAAKHANEGNHEQSVYHAHLAHGHQKKAKEHSDEATKKHLDNAMNRMGKHGDHDSVEGNSNSKGNKTTTEKRHAEKS